MVAVHPAAPTHGSTSARQPVTRAKSQQSEKIQTGKSPGAPEAAWPETPGTPAVEASGSKSANTVFLPIPFDLCGLVISSWLVPTVKRPLRGVKTFVFAALVQAGVLCYMVAAMVTADPAKSPCNSPALLQLLGLYIFTASMLNEINSLRLLHIAFVTTRLKVPGGPEQETLPSGAVSNRLVQGADKILDIRPTSATQRMLLALAPLAEVSIEVATLFIGALYLILSESIEDLILNAVAVNFVTQIDEICLHAFVNKASRVRLGKYYFEQKFGVEDGDTQMKNASRNNVLLERLTEYLPVIVLGISLAGVAAAQFIGRTMDGDVQCTWFLAQE